MFNVTRYLEKVTQDSKQPHTDWFELYGETEPILSSDAHAATGALYEYCWALGYSEKLFTKLHKVGWLQQLRRRLPLRRRDDGKSPPHWSAYPAAHVFLYFPADCDWRVSEIVATIKHLSPVQQERNWREEFAKDFTAIEPVIGAAGKVAADATGMPELGSVAEAISRLKLTSVPQTTGAMWFVRRVDDIQSERLFYGIEWELSLGLLEQLGNRVTGGLLVSFTGVQPGVKEGELVARAEMHYDVDTAKNGHLPDEGVLKLCLKPKLDAKPRSTDH
jgi:hypothetical protein